MKNKNTKYLIFALGSCILIAALLVIAIAGNAVFNPTTTIVLCNGSSEPLFNVRITVFGKDATVNKLPDTKDFSASFKSIGDSGISVSFSRCGRRCSMSYGYVTNGSNEKHVIVIPSAMKEATVSIIGNHFGFPPYRVHEQRVPLQMHTD